MNRRHFAASSVSLLGAGLAAFQPAWAQGAAPVEGKDFSRLEPPQPVREAGKVEVLEFFSYACPHCSSFEPALDNWARQLPPDVVLRRVPVPFLMNAENFQRTYYALESLGLVPTLQQKIFRAIHIDRQRLDKAEDIAAFVGRNGGDEAKFLAAFKSFSVATSVSRAKKAVADHKVESVPLLVINGRYVTSPSMAGGGPQTLAVAEQLIQRSRGK